MNKIRFCYKNTLKFLSQNEIDSMSSKTTEVAKILENGSGLGNDFLGWIDLPEKYSLEEINKIKSISEKIKSNSEILIVIGIGGSYLGARAGIEFLSHTFKHILPKEKKEGIDIIFAGQNISGTYLKDLLEILEKKEYSINIISKSGTTTEPALAFRVLKNHLEKKYGKNEAKNRIFATTDSSKGALKQLSLKEGYETFDIPDNVGGRFTVLTPVGLLPMAVAGINISELLSGAAYAKEYYNKEFSQNDVYKYATIRTLLHQKGKEIELLANYEPKFHYFAEWWKQLFGESEGKDGKGIFPASVDYSTDLHSLGQLVQDGKRHLFETVLSLENPSKDILVESEKENLDNLNYLVGKGFNYINKKAKEATVLAHVHGGVPNLEFFISDASAYSLGQLFYFFEKACAISAYLSNVNPFDQPGVEAYKINMCALLDKPGYEKEKEFLINEDII